MGALGIISESLRLPFRIGKLGSFLALFLIIPSSLIFVCNVFVLKPRFLDLFLKSSYLRNSVKETLQYDEFASVIRDDVRVIVGEEAVFILAGHIVSMLATVATIYASAVTYSSKKPTFKDLILRMVSIWKRPLITYLWIILFKLGYLFFLVLLIGFLAMIADQDSALLLALAIFTTLCGLLCYLYLVVVWNLGLVISVVEEGYQGLTALGKAGQFIKGRKLQGFVLSILVTVATVAMSWILGLLMNNVKNGEATYLAIAVVRMDFSCLMTLYSTIVYTVFYCVCKESQGEEIEAQGTSGYSLITSKAHVDATLP
ncbi:uncharacterized protein [Aristolochia californica]|uniref:uncharacterized protein n=1 Tax=Aristolochia californica TaxID=171875 RepID=UPI0035D708A8